ncbi:hypothetical protein NCU10304 [Neurospora crassa OR74A]|uniref:Uncharacterized protein n=2 Tax=Neurospora crassa TaxID=5141 RepID=A7UWA1_NEUCR|nr:hypothetical protein NCU10304 [Neurospora crassa OR74A]EDO65268.1 hypothetical protein NCU10304 [Neurospora crassa OR74A]CAF05860.1 hypothetical protein B23N11.080 [Neurospora crassa]|eukprot:XP_001728359.1 hypothetical protein NCU10304 [Neurospora crassa OR74A]
MLSEYIKSKQPMGFKRTDSYRPRERQNSNGRDSSRPAGGGSRSRTRRRSNSQQASPPRGPAASRPWNHSGRNFSAPNWSYHQQDASRYEHQHGRETSSEALGEITNRSPLPSPRARPDRSRSPDDDDDDEDSLFVSDGPGPEFFEDYAEPEPEPLPRPPPTMRLEIQDGQSEFPDAFHRRPKPISASRIASGMYFQARGKPILPPLTAKPNSSQTGKNVLKPRYISTSNIPIEASTTQPKAASKKPVGTPSKPSASSKPIPPKTDASMKAAALSNAAGPLTSGTGMPSKPPVPLDTDNDSSSSAPRVPSTLTIEKEPSRFSPFSFPSRRTTSGGDKLVCQELQQSVHRPTLPSTFDSLLPNKSRPENKRDPKSDPASTRSIQKRKVGDLFSAADLKIIWKQCFEQRQPPDQSRLGHFALPIPSHSLHLVSPAQLERAKRYFVPDIVRFEVTPLQLGKKKSRSSQANARLFHSDPTQIAGRETSTPTYHKLQLRPSTSQTDGLAWPVLRAMQVGWELTARWYKEVIVDGGWVSLGRLDREDTVMSDAMDIDGENENDKVITSRNSKNPVGTGLGDFVANELKKNVVKTKHSRDEPEGSLNVDREIGRWLDHVWREQN